MSLIFHNTNNNSNNNNHHNKFNSSSNKKTKTSVHYQLFMHQEELRRRASRHIHIAKSKINLTQSLISENIQKLNDCSIETLKIINREMSFKKHLQTQLTRYAKLAKLGVSFQRGIENGPTITKV